MKYLIEHDGRDHVIEIVRFEEGRGEIRLNGKVMPADWRRTGNGTLVSLLLGGLSYELLVLDEGRRTRVIHHGLSVSLKVESERERNARLIAQDSGGDGAARITAVMPGIVVSIAVREGDPVTKGQSVAILEAMKMENEIRSPAAGKVLKVAVAPGSTVNAGDLLVEIGPA